ncbi:putative nuclease HARBI1 [Bienertia sinuspersici]
MMDMFMEIIFDLMSLLTIMNIKIPKPITYAFDNFMEERSYARILNIKPMIQGSDVACLNNLRMDRACFYKFYEILRDVGKLKGNRNASLEEIVVLFLFTLSHDTKNQRTQLYFRRTGETVSRHFNLVLRALLKGHHILLKKPNPVTENCQDDKWKWFTNCLGALDGTHIKVRVGDKDKVRFRNRKGEISTNVLGVCTRNMQFVYVLPGWESSAHDNKVLRDALTRRNPLKVPQGNKKIFFLYLLVKKVIYESQILKNVFLFFAFRLLLFM